MTKSFKDFPPLYIIIMLLAALAVVLWGFFLIGGYQLSVVELPSTTPVATIPWLLVLLQFILSVITLVGILKYAVLKIEEQSSKEHLNGVIDNLRKKLQQYEPGYEDIEAD